MRYQFDTQPALVQKLEHLFATFAPDRAITVGTLSTGIGVFEMVVETFESVWKKISGVPVSAITLARFMVVVSC